MKKGIYYDSKRKSWYIHTAYKGRTITIRGFASKKEADENYDFAIEKWRREHGIISTQNVFDTIANDYVEFVRNGKSSRTADRERTQIRTYWLPIFQGQTLSNIYNYERLKLLYSNIQNDNSLKQRKKHDIVYTFLQFSHFAYINRMISKDNYEEAVIVFQPIHYAKSVENERQVIPQCDLMRFLDTIRHESERDYTLFALLAFCGLRASELLGLCNDCFVENKVIVKRQLLITGNLSDKLKTKQSYRQVPIKSDLTLLINKYKKDNKDRYYKISHTQFKRLLYYYETKAGIGHYVPHEFRHTCCYELAKKCENISEVVYCAKIMGHSVSVFTNTYCSHLDNSLESKFFG